MEEKVVIYNGGTNTYGGCSSPTKLKKGEKYVVDSIIPSPLEPHYTFKGVVGEFNTKWFD